MKKTNCPNLAKNLIILLILSLVFTVLFSGSIYALSSDNINLQGKIVRNDTGHEGMNVIPGSPACVVDGPGNDTCDFRVSYYNALTGGTLLLTEDFTNVEIGQFDGVFELSLGSGTVTTTVQCRDGTCNSPSEVISEYGDLYIELQFAPDGSTLTETFTRMPLEATPYSIFSKFAEGAHDAFKLSTSVSNESLENPSAGMIYFDTGSSQLKVYNGAEWQALSAGTSSSLWTDAGTYSYLTSTTDDLVLGGSSFSTGRFIFDMDGGSGSYFDVFNNDHSNKLFTILSSGNVGIGTATPGAKLEVGGTASVISNNSGDITIDPVSNLVVTSRVYQTGLGGSTYFGENAGRVDDLSSNYNTGIGYNSLYSNTTGYFNTALGPYSLYSNITGYSNTALGYRSLYSNTSGDSNTAVGNNSLYSNTSGYFNTALGNNSLSSNITGNSNTAVGNNSLYSNTTGIYNTAVGHASLYFNTTGNYNTALGYASLYSNTIGNYNTALGYYAGVYQADGVTALTDSENSIYIGYNAKGKDNDDNNSIVIGYNAVGLGANTVVLGNDSIVTTALKGNVGIGTTSPTQKLDVLGGIRLGTTSNVNNVLDTQAQSGAPSGSLYWGNAPLLTSANLGSFGVASISNSDGTLTISPTTGNVIASLNLSNANTWTGMQTFRGLKVESATATDDRIVTSITTGGSARYDGTLTNADLTAARTWALPDKSGTIAMTSDIPVSDNYQYWVLQANGATGSNITSTSAVSFNGSGIVTTSRSGNTITITGTEADTLQSVTNRGATTTVSSSFTGGATIRGLTVDNATTTYDRILITAASVGTARYNGTLTNADLTAARTWTLPNNSGTIALTSDIPAGHDPVTLSGENYLSLNVQQITANKINLTSNVTGILPIGSGGTNSTTYTSNQFLWYNGTSIVASGYNQNSFASSSHSHNWSQITNGSGIYMDYRPNNTACGSNQVLKYDTTYSRWICADDNAGTGDNWGSQVVITNSTLTGNGTSGSPLGIALSNANTWTGMQTFRGLTVENATTTYDTILITTASVGTARYNGKLTNADLTAARTWTLPNNSGTIALTTDIPIGPFVSGTGSAGQVSYWSGTTSITGSNSFWWDSTNSRLGIGTNTPQATLSVKGLVYQIGLGYSTYFGEGAGSVDDLSSNYNTGIGYNSLRSNTTGYGNTALGYYSLYSNTTGYYNTGIGYNSLRLNTTGYYNTALGYYSLYSNTGNYNTAVGHNSLRSNTGNYNTALGYASLYSNTTGYYNTAVGNNSLRSNTTGRYNTAVGHNSLYSNTTGYYNTALGNYSLFSNTTGSYNTALGYYAGAYQADGVTALTDSENSIYIGYNAKGKDNDDNNSIVIGYNAVGLGANTVVLGNDSIVTTALKGTVGIGDYLKLFSGDAQTVSTPFIRASSSNNLVLNGYSTGGVYLNWDSTGTGGVYVGDGAGINKSNQVFTLANSAANRGRIYSQANDALANSADANAGLEVGPYRVVSAVSGNSLYEYYSNASSVAYRIITTGTAMDLAEWYPVGDIDLDSNRNSTIKKGEVLCMDNLDATKVVKCDSDHTNIIGIASTASYTTMGIKDMDDLREDDVEVALTGRVPAIVTSKNGPIAIGDFITYSNLRGVGQKATQKVQVVAKALDSFNPSSCTPASSLESIVWPIDENGDNPTKPCYQLPDGTFVGKIMVFPNISVYNPSETYTTTNITNPGWYRISQLNGTDDYAKFKINNSSIGSSQNLILSVDTVNEKENINIVSNFVSGGYDISKARINTVNGVKYLEIYLETVNENRINVSIEGNMTNWISTSIEYVESPTIVNKEFAFKGVLFGVSDKLEVEEDNIKITGNLLSSSLNSSIGDSANRWNDIYAKGTIRLGSGVDGEGAIRFNVQTKTLEFSNNGVEWLSVGDLSSQMTISPEYAGAILFADGSDNSGIMTSDAIEENGSFKNYYEWVSNKDTPQDYDILVRITLPTDFLSWKEDAIYLDIMTENSVSTDNNSVGLSLIGNSGTDVQITGGISKIAGSWERMSIKGADITQCNSAGGTCTLRISLTSSMEYFTRVGDITLNYNRSL